MLSRLVTASLAALVLLGFGTCSRPPKTMPQLIVIAWDGAGDWVVDKLLAESQLPHLARLAASGVAAEHSVTSFPSKTAVGFATLWTGCWPDRHGVTANAVLPQPAAEHDLLESTRGFASRVLHAEPFFVTAAKAGRKVVVLSSTQSYPPEP
ncbi:MAG: alkaline phosphatase family protein, partial [Acidobacteriota bacterium]